MNACLKRCALLALLTLSLLLTSCASLLPDPVRDAVGTLSPEEEAVFPAAQAPESAAARREVTLYFRYGDQPYLAPEIRTVTIAADQSLEMVLLQELSKGPGSRSTQLTAALPEGCGFIAAVSQERTLFVTLGSSILKGWTDEPADWTASAYWQVEAPLRRQLCVQSIVATLTENCDYDQVQFLVEQTNVLRDSLRLRQSWFLDGADDTVLSDPIPRQEELLLSPGNTLRALLDAWKSRDAALLYGYLTQRPDLADCQQAVTDAPLLLSYAFSGGAVSPDGQTIHYTLRLCWQDTSGQSRETSGLAVRLTRVDGLWKLPWAQFTQLIQAMQ